VREIVGETNAICHGRNTSPLQTDGRLCTVHAKPTPSFDDAEEFDLSGTGKRIASGLRQ